MNTRFAGYPSALVYRDTDGQRGRQAVQHLLWGDWLTIKPEMRGRFVQVRARGVDGWMHTEDIQSERLLEVVFVDIGQGDGALIVTPQDKHLVVDAGEGDHLARFLRWRYGRFAQPFVFEAAVISHPDADHYGGFERLFNLPNLTFDTLYHNGILERAGAATLGPTAQDGKVTYLTEPVLDFAQLKALLEQSAVTQGKRYPTLLARALAQQKFREARMLSVESGHLPGYAADQELRIRVLGPVVERDAGGRPRLRSFGTVGKTKNGHSVVLRLEYRQVSLLLGGDLNIPAEEFLLRSHTGLAVPPKEPEAGPAIVETARKVFQVDIAKSCHHGSADFSTLYLQAVNPIATVISSGDNEPHSHPRADALGATGRYSRGARPLIFSTELARSAREAIRQPALLRRELLALQRQIDAAPENTPGEQRKKARLLAKFETLVQALDRSIAVYGAINVRTDGDKVVIAQKIESASPGKKWDIYRLEREGNGPLRYVAED